MRMVSLLGWAVVCATSAPLDAQKTPVRSQGSQRPTELMAKTITLRHLTSDQAVKMLAPYVRSKDGGVFDVPNVRAVTIRETARVIAEMEKVLAEYDRSPAAVTLNFQLIAADNSTTRDPNVAALDSLLRNVLRFTGYRLLLTTVANASEGGRVSQVLAVAKPSGSAIRIRGAAPPSSSSPLIIIDGIRQGELDALAQQGEPDTFVLIVDVTDIRAEGAEASVHLNVMLLRQLFATGTKIPATQQTLLSTGVTVPTGHTVVLGTATTDGSDGALILTVRPQLADPKR